MNNSYHFFRYVPIESKMHLMNSKMKTIWFIFCFLSLLIVKDYLSLFMLFIFLCVVVICSRIKIVNYLSGILILWPIYFVLFLLVFLISTSVSVSILITTKVVLIVLLFLIITSTTSLSEIAWGLECAFSSLKKIKIPVSKISLRIAMDIKFISLIFDEYKEIRKSMAYRGVSYKKNNVKSFKRLIVPVISLSYKNSRRMVKIMRLRFYGKSNRRTNYHDNKTTAFDKVLVIISIILVYVTILIGWC